MWRRVSRPIGWTGRKLLLLSATSAISATSAVNLFQHSGSTRRKWTMKVDHVETSLQTCPLDLDRLQIASSFGDLGDLGGESLFQHSGSTRRKWTRWKSTMWRRISRPIDWTARKSLLLSPISVTSGGQSIPTP
jgi:hypothetical protein